jgi:hypothetical protein
VKAAEVVRESLKHLGFTEGALSRDQAVQALEAIAKQPGIVGISARFALSRLLLKPGNGP